MTPARAADESALEAYVSGVDSAAAPLVRALDAAILGAHPDFDVAVKYRILMYSLRADWKTWVCAIDARKKAVSLRFLYGVLLDDPLGVLRAGTSVLKTWDFGLDEVIDAKGVGRYVREAVARYDEYKRNASDVLKASRSGATTPERPKPAG